MNNSIHLQKKGDKEDSHPSKHIQREAEPESTPEG
jgi:hypothetical protein